MFNISSCYLPPVIPRGIRGSVGQAFLPLSVIAWWHQAGIYCPIPLHRPILGSLVIVLSHKMAETSGFDTHWRLGPIPIGALVATELIMVLNGNDRGAQNSAQGFLVLAALAGTV